jgi:hypothetical protein
MLVAVACRTPCDCHISVANVVLRDAAVLQAIGRGHAGRIVASMRRWDREQRRALDIQRVVRGRPARVLGARLQRRAWLASDNALRAAVLIQRVMRGHACVIVRLRALDAIRRFQKQYRRHCARRWHGALTWQVSHSQSLCHMTLAVQLWLLQQLQLLILSLHRGRLCLHGVSDESVTLFWFD